MSRLIRVLDRWELVAILNGTVRREITEFRCFRRYPRSIFPRRTRRRTFKTDVHVLLPVFFFEYTKQVLVFKIILLKYTARKSNEVTWTERNRYNAPFTNFRIIFTENRDIAFVSWMALLRCVYNNERRSRLHAIIYIRFASHKTSVLFRLFVQWTQSRKTIIRVRFTRNYPGGVETTLRIPDYLTVFKCASDIKSF